METQVTHLRYRSGEVILAGDAVEYFGERFIRAFAQIKTAELMAFEGVISSWERNHLLLKV